MLWGRRLQRVKVSQGGQRGARGGGTATTDRRLSPIKAVIAAIYYAVGPTGRGRPLLLVIRCAVVNPRVAVPKRATALSSRAGRRTSRS